MVQDFLGAASEFTNGLIAKFIQVDKYAFCIPNKSGRMISADTPFDQTTVADHYDDLDSFYREIWGEHVHHGFWTTGTESPEIAVQRLVDSVAEKAQIKPGDRVLDIGCGYGASARQLAQQYGADVTAITLSPVQYAHSQGLSREQNPRYLLADWLRMDFPAQLFQAAIAIESTEHMPDRVEFFRKAFDVLKVGGRLVVCAWLTRERPSPWETRWLLRPICVEGRIPHLMSLAELERAAETAGFVIVESRDCTRAVCATWGIILRRLVEHLLKDPRYRAFLLDRRQSNRVFGLTVLRIWLAYKMGAMRYGILTVTRPV
jgi:tocopherol O-methyltransferase